MILNWLILITYLYIEIKDFHFLFLLMVIEYACKLLLSYLNQPVELHLYCFFYLNKHNCYAIFNFGSQVMLLSVDLAVCSFRSDLKYKIFLDITNIK